MLVSEHMYLTARTSATKIHNGATSPPSPKALSPPFAVPPAGAVLLVALRRMSSHPCRPPFARRRRAPPCLVFRCVRRAVLMIIVRHAASPPFPRANFCY